MEPFLLSKDHKECEGNILSSLYTLDTRIQELDTLDLSYKHHHFKAI